MKILLGDFNVKVGTEYIFRPTIENGSPHQDINDNCFSPLPVQYKNPTAWAERLRFFQWAFKFTYCTRNRSPLQGEKS